MDAHRSWRADLKQPGGLLWRDPSHENPRLLNHCFYECLQRPFLNLELTDRVGWGVTLELFLQCRYRLAILGGVSGINDGLDPYRGLQP
jgi:hypothetical protein